MRKKCLKFYSDPTRDPSFETLQTKWYARLLRDGFQDHEDSAYSDRPLKRWSGISSIYVDKFQPPGIDIVSSFPESLFKEEENLKNHPDFETLCKTLGKHGNSKLTPGKVRGIWEDYCNGKTLRQMEVKYSLSDNRIFVAIRKITEWMNIMDTRPDNPGNGDSATIILRPFDRDNHTMSDSSMIYSTWRNALWFDEKRDERKANEFYSLATRAIKELLRLPKTVVKIACAKDEPDFIAGYSVMTGSHLHFVYVKINYRKKGIARLLTKGTLSVEEPCTKLGKIIVETLGLPIKENHGTVQ